MLTNKNVSVAKEKRTIGFVGILVHIGFFGSVSGAVHQKNPNVRKQSVQKSDLQKSAFWRVWLIHASRRARKGYQICRNCQPRLRCAGKEFAPPFHFAQAETCMCIIPSNFMFRPDQHPTPNVNQRHPTSTNVIQRHPGAERSCGGRCRGAGGSGVGVGFRRATICSTAPFRYSVCRMVVWSFGRLGGSCHVSPF